MKMIMEDGVIYESADKSEMCGDLSELLDLLMSDVKKEKEHAVYVINPFAKFGGSFDKISESGNVSKVHITKVLYNNPATVVWWSDGTITRNICPDDALYNPDTGLAFCWLKKMFNSDDIAKLFHDWAMPDGEDGKNVIVSLKDVRKKHK